MHESTRALRALLPLLSFSLLLSSCRPDAAEAPHEPAAGGVRDSVPPPAVDTTTVSADSAAVTGPADERPVVGTSRRAALIPARIRRELVDSVSRFIGSIDGGDETRFWGMIAERSRRFVGTPSGGTREEIWKAAQETLGNLGRPAIRFVGGTRDSVSLLVSRISYQRVDSLTTDTLDDPVIIHFVREDGGWKAIYPGLLYPEHALQR
jgi:hypothetical protein